MITPDGNLNVNHPSVVDAGPGGWNGYRYWIAFTPYPSNVREEPCVLASNDKVAWVEPAGITNPVAPTPANADHNSDPQLLLLSNGTMQLYYRPYGGSVNEIIGLRESTDGVNWTLIAAQVIQIVTSPGNYILSPTVVQEDDDTLHMWTVNASAATNGQRIERRTSTDLGRTWSAPTTCTIPAVTCAAWHIDVQRDGDRYPMIISSRDWSLYFWDSDDGLTFTGDDVNPTVPRSGTTIDKEGHYRTCFLPNGDGTYDVFASCINSPTSDVFNVAGTWRIARLANLDLAAMAAA